MHFQNTCIITDPTTSDHINIKYIWGPHGKPYGDPTLITHRDLKRVYTLNKFNIIFRYLLLRNHDIIGTHINLTLHEYYFILTIYSNMVTIKHQKM